MKNVNIRFYNKYHMARSLFTTYYMMNGCTVEVWQTNMYTGVTSWKFTETFKTVCDAFKFVKGLEHEYHALYVRDFSDMEL